MKKNEFKQYVVVKGGSLQEVTITIKGAEKLEEYMFPVLLASMLGQASERNEAIIMTSLMTFITRIADLLGKETFDLIMELGALELKYLGRE